MPLCTTSGLFRGWESSNGLWRHGLRRPLHACSSHLILATTSIYIYDSGDGPDTRRGSSCGPVGYVRSNLARMPLKLGRPLPRLCPLDRSSAFSFSAYLTVHDLDETNRE